MKHVYRKLNCRLTCNYQIKCLSAASVDSSILFGAFCEIIVAAASVCGIFPALKQKKKEAENDLSSSQVTQGCRAITDRCIPMCAS
jgi:hypothetical protein